MGFLDRFVNKLEPLAPKERSLEPVSRVFGLDRGTAICRHYIHEFLAASNGDIRGRVMEVADANYTKRFGGRKVTKSEVLHATEGNKNATLVGDLATGRGIPDDAFDCVIATQLYPFIFEIQEAIRHTHRSLKEGGVLLATGSGISQISRYDMDRWGDFWRLTTASAERLFGDIFGGENIQVRAHGNVLVACGYLQGLAAEEFSAEELAHHDPDYQVLITVRAVKRKAA
jgi:SAM-dependent methyltransferase